MYTVVLSYYKRDAGKTRGTMMRKCLSIISVAILAFLMLLAGCYEPGGPVPEGAHAPVARDYTQEDVDEIVVVEEQVISSPLPDEWGAPDACDEIHFLRFRPADGSTLDAVDPSRVNAEATDAMLVMLPGVFEGANGFEYLGRQLVYMAKVQDGLNMEVWAVERRNNRLEDLSAVNFIEGELAAGQLTTQEGVETFVGYHYDGQSVNGHTFDGWYVNEDLPFLSEFGLRLDTEDVFTVIQTLVPDPEVRREKVFVGGHSMGGPMTVYFVGWDLDGDPATTYDAGYNNCAGIFGFDTSLAPMSGTFGAFSFALPPAIAGKAEITAGDFSAALAELRNGTSAVVLNSPPLLGAESMDLLEATAMAAYFDPDSEATYMRDVPWSGDMQLLLNLMHSLDLMAFMLGVPQVRDFRYTNEAMLGVMFDDSFAPIGMIQNSMGFLEGGPVVEKDFPVYPLNAIPGISGMLGKGPYYIANDAGPSYFELGDGPLYSWVNFDEIGDASDPDYTDTTGETTYTSMENEVADIQDVARVIFKGPLNLVEWYFSVRLLADFQAAGTPFGPEFGLDFLHGDEVVEMPQVLFLAGEGTHTGDDGQVGVVYHLAGYNHMDVLTASANTTTRRPNEVIRPLIDFIVDNM